MTETPDQRRDRIDEARREQAELLRQIGHEHATNVIRPSAMEAWRNLQFTLTQVDEKKERRPCRGREEEFTGYDAFNVPSPGRAKMMCAGCKALEQCGIYGEVAKPEWSVYGGVVHGRTLAEKERRETLRTVAQAMREKREEQEREQTERG